MQKRAIIADLGGGVHRVTQPLPWALDHVHCYAVEDPDGWTIFDSGLGTPGTTARWREAYAELGSPRVRRVVATHYHPDHNGATAALMEVTGADVFVQGRRDHELTYPGVPRSDRPAAVRAAPDRDGYADRRGPVVGRRRARHAVPPGRPRRRSSTRATCSSSRASGSTSTTCPGTPRGTWCSWAPRAAACSAATRS